MDKNEFETLLKIFCETILGTGVLQHHKRLSSGASVENHYFEYNDKPYILRCSSNGDDVFSNDSGAISVDDQAMIMNIAVKHKVKAPYIVAMLEKHHGLGVGYLMDHITGETLPHKIFKKYDDEFLSNVSQQLAQQLAAIHATSTEIIADQLSYLSPHEMVQELRESYAGLNANIVIFEWAFAWLENHMLKSCDAVLLHGDYRMGNIMIDDNGLAAILDWELCHLGDPVQDMAYLCAPSWRFGQYHNMVAGIDTIDNFLQHYEDAGGIKINRERFQFWLIYSTLWWGMVCIGMAEAWRSGDDRSLEKIVIGTRVSEVELDLLLLLEDDCPSSEDLKAWTLPDTVSEHKGSTHVYELLESLTEWNSDYVMVSAEGHNVFQARVAQNALGILKRSQLYGDIFKKADQQRVNALAINPEDMIDHIQLGEGK